MPNPTKSELLAENRKLARRIAALERARKKDAALSENRYDIAMRAINEGVYDWDIAKGTIYYSDRVRAATGMDPEAMRTPEDWRSRIHPEDLPGYDRALIDHFKGRTERFEVEYRYRGADGAWHWARQHGIAVRDPKGRAVRLVGSTGEITDLKRVEAALKASEERYALAMRVATEGIYDWDVATGNLYLSDKAREFWGFAPGPLKNTDWLEHLHPEDAPGYRQAIVEHFKGRRPHIEHELRVRNAKGEFCWVIDRGIALRDAGGRAVRLVGATSDITQRKLAEQELRRAHHEAKEALERQTATAEILKVIAASPSDVRPVFDAIARNAQRLLGGRSSVVTRVNGVNLDLVAFTSTGAEGDEVLKAIRSRPLSATHDIHCRVAVSGTPEFQADIEADPQATPEGRAMARARGFRSVLSVPMMREGVAVGTIGVTRAKVGDFSEHDLSLMKTFADQAVIAIENVRLFNETKEALDRQTATSDILASISGSMTDAGPVFNAIVRNLMTLFNTKYAVVQLLHGETIEMPAVGGDPGFEKIRENYPRSLDRTTGGGIAMLEKRTVQISPLIDNPHAPETIRRFARDFGFDSALFSPMLRDGEVIGAVGFGNRVAKVFDAKEIALLETFAAQAVIAIENVRLFNETKESLEQQTAISEILRVISTSPGDVQPVLDAVAERAARICAAPYADIVLRDGDSMNLQSAVGLTIGRPTAAEKLPCDRGSVMGRSIVDASIMHIADLQDSSNDEEFAYGRTLALKYGHRTTLAVPLVRDGRALGTIVLRRKEVRPFEDKHITLLRTFADQAAIAIENARLFNQTKEALERQTATAEILKVIAASPSDVQPVFDAIAQSAMRLLGGRSAIVTEVVGEHLQLKALTSTGAEGDRIMRELFPISLSDPRPLELFLGVVRTGEIAFRADAQNDPAMPEQVREMARARGFRSALAVPMLRNGKAIGSINVTRAESGHFPPHQVELLKTFADQATIAIENVRLFNETKEALERQTATAEILKVIASSPSDVQPVFDAIARSAMRLIRGQSSAVTRVEGDMVELVALTSTTNEGDEALRKFFPVLRSHPRSLHAQVARSGQPAIRTDTEKDPNMIESGRELARARGYRSDLVVPMLQDGTAIGAISVTRSEPGTFTEHQINLLETFADQAVIAIENVRLFKELESRTTALSQSVQQLTALGEVGHALSSTLDLETVLKTIVARATQLTGLDGGAIYEYDAERQEFRLQTAEHLAEELVQAARDEPIRLGNGAIGQAGLTREPVQVPDTLADSYQSDRKAVLNRVGYRALVAVPLLREDNLLGALLVTRRAPGTFPQETVALLQTFATQSAMAIQNARLFREIAEKGRQLEVASRHKSDFLASMSHELRTPLNAILGFNELIIAGIYGEPPDEMKEPLNDIQTSGKHLLRLINNVLDLAKIEAGRMELALADYSVHDTVESVRSTLRPLAAEKGLDFVTSVPDEIPLAHGDFGRITQCLMNLAGNSLKFTKQGRVEIAVQLKEGVLVYQVNDTGIGIPPDKIGSLFTEFRQTDATIASEYGGTGLGLSISKKFIEMHGGRVWVESEVGKGSSFVFEVPLRAGTARGAES